ncbi:hypothetical protein [Leptothoe sp. PORK10 BA2]|uniref:hypothetical protein n=1 Tax=Leptothoe sp. PORK10 BA2 TaxID=3110254 RepID=UPI002B1ED802|nr:hypothetical protein [Leptothoe sp. PORK10 BA2]MEA5464612.1 hypothetical protein [Leptothoe sp. PORK10 BA2]
MRVSIEKGFQPLVLEVMEQIRVDDPKLAINHIIGSWAAGQQCPNLPASGHQVATQTETGDEFSQIADWS